MGNPSSAAASAAKGPSLRTGARDNIFVFDVGRSFVALQIRLLRIVSYNNQDIFPVANSFEDNVMEFVGLTHGLSSGVWRFNYDGNLPGGCHG